VPTIGAVLGAMQAQVSLVMAPLVGIDVQVGTDWPSVKVLMENVRGQSALVTVYDRKMGRNSTRWKPIGLGDTLIPATLTTAISNGTIPGGGSATITLGGTVTPGDAVSCVLSAWSRFNTDATAVTGENPIATPTWAQIVTGGPGDTPSTMAAALCTAINADSLLSKWVIAQVAGPVITLYSLLTVVGADGGGPILTDPSGLPISLDGPTTTLRLQSYAGNGGTRLTEIGRRNRELQITAWAPTIEIRDQVAGALELMIQQMELGWTQYPSGLPFQDGTSGRIMMLNDFFLDDATPSDTYRYDLLCNADYPVTEVDGLYAVLAGVVQYQVGYAVTT